ncbi:hypothetical protein ACH5RR_037416 [Cinchona calisaya]|uniref:F-box associated domain-containing protein n=1 Tax=Cinchona calisaya TaxID=153742 RepID=A0ABD2YAT4_9GENT
MSLGHAKNHHVFLVKQCINDEKKALLSFHSNYASSGSGIANEFRMFPQRVWDWGLIYPPKIIRWARILSFNMCTEAFQKIEFPLVYKPRETRWNIAALNDSLAFILFKSRIFKQSSIHGEHSINIWVMMECGIRESWFKKNSDNIHQQICKYDLYGYASLEALVYEGTLVSFARIGNGLYWKKMWFHMELILEENEI